MKPTDLKKMVSKELEKVISPEKRLTLNQMKTMKGVKEQESEVVQVDFITSKSFCPMAFKLAKDTPESGRVSQLDQKGNSTLLRSQHEKCQQYGR